MTVLLLFLSSCLAIVWTLPVLLFNVMDMKMCRISNRQKVIKSKKILKGVSSVINDDGSVSGFVVGKFYIGYYNIKISMRGNETEELWLLANKKTIKLLEDDGNDTENTLPTMKVWNRSGCFFDIKYSHRTIIVNESIKHPKPSQQNIIDNITEKWKGMTRLVTLIHGHPGSGKSTIAFQLANVLNGSLLKTWIPTDPGDDFNSVYEKISPTKDSPLIVLIDECDIILDKISKGVELHKHIPIQIKDKPTWNGFFDDVNRGYYSYVIFMLTTNLNPNQIKEKYDTSYIREGRVDLFFEL